MKLMRKLLAMATAFTMGTCGLCVNGSADTAADGLLILTGSYSDSSYYPTSRPLGIANTFHLFAFDSIELAAHCNGNFAAPHVDASQASGTNQNNNATGTHPEVSVEVSVATESIKIQGSTLITDLLIPIETLVTDSNGNFTVSNPISGQLRIDGNLVDMNHSGEKHIYHVHEDYIDFAKYQAKYGNLSKNASKLEDTITHSAKDNVMNITLSDTGMNVVNLTGKEFYDAQNGFNIHNAIYVDTDNDGEADSYTGQQSLVINVDLAGYTEYTTNSQVKIYRSDDSVVTNREINVNDGTIVLWNFYDSSSADGLFHGTINYGKTSLGSVLAPYADVNADQNIDGNIIAESIRTGAESHRCDFMGPLTISWDDPTTTTSTTTSATTTSATTTSATTTSATTTSATTTSATTTSATTTSATTTSATTTSATTTSATTTSATTTSATTTSATTTSATTTSATTTSATTTSATTTSATTTSATTTSATTTSATTTSATTTSATTTSATTTEATTTEATTTTVEETTTAPVVTTTAEETTTEEITTTTSPSIVGGEGDDVTSSVTTTVTSEEDDEDPSIIGGDDDEDDEDPSLIGGDDDEDDEDPSLIGGDTDEDDDKVSDDKEKNPITGERAPAVMTLIVAGFAVAAVLLKKDKKVRD